MIQTLVQQLFKPLVAVGTILMSLMPCWAQAQQSDYPNRPITFVVPYAVGNVNDLHARLIAQALGARLGQTVVVENKPGASGIIGTQYAANAKPDGYTMVLGTTSTMGSHPSLYKKLPYSPLESFVPVNGLVYSSLVMVVTTTKQYKNLKEFLDYAKSHPGEVTYGSPGVGSGPHLAGGLFEMATGTSLLHVAYKDASSLYGDLISGRADVVFDFLPVMKQYMAKGSVIPLGITQSERLKSFPDLPTLKDAGIPVDLTLWTVVLMPAGTPADIVQKMSTALQAAMKSPPVAKFEQDVNAVSMATMGPDKLPAFMRSEMDKYRAVIKKVGITLDY